jgi:hypothetical protein
MVFYSHFLIWVVRHGLLFHLSFLLCYFSWSIFLDIKHEVFNQCSSWYSIPLTTLIVMLFMIICSSYLTRGHWCLLWSPLEALITMLFMDIFSPPPSLRSLPWSSIRLLCSVDIFVVVFYVPIFLILGIKGPHCHNFSFAFITKIGAWQRK